MIVAVILWVLCAIGAALIANAKGRSMTGFFFAGLLLGVIGLVWAACARRDEPERPLVMPRGAGWYQDPYDWAFERYWDGTAWSRDVRQQRV